MILKLINLYYTLRYLKPIQIISRICLFFKKSMFKYFITRKTQNQICQYIPPKLSLCDKPVVAHQVDLDRKEFTFLNYKNKFSDMIQWNSMVLDKLWVYNLHYFEYLLPITKKRTQKNYKSVKNIIYDWINQNPAGFGTGWEPYPISLRIINWIFFYDAFYSYFKKDHSFRASFIQSLYQQCFYLCFFLEFHLMANHLFANIKALICAGLFFKKTDWIQRGWDLFEREIYEQILDDGGHFERCPMYHAIILNDILDIIHFIDRSNLDKTYNYIFNKKSILIEKVERMLVWMKAMTHPDEDIALFGDSAFQVSLSYHLLNHYFRQIQNKKKKVTKISNRDFDCLFFQKSGYTVFKSRDQYLVIDGGDLGVQYNPAHAHCDLFSYEYSYKKNRFIVDSGLGNYKPSSLRQKTRSIYSHNTVVVNGLEQGQIWKTFRMGKRIKSPEISVKKEKDGWTFEGDYVNQIVKKKMYRHHRELFFNGFFFRIVDSIEGRNIDTIENLLHVHPECRISQYDNQIIFNRENLSVHLLYNEKSVQVEIQNWFYSPQFNLELPSQVVRIKPIDLSCPAMAYYLVPEEFLNHAKEYELACFK